MKILAAFLCLLLGAWTPAVRYVPPQNFIVDGANGSDAAGDGWSDATAWKTAQYAVSQIRLRYDFQGWAPTLWLYNYGGSDNGWQDAGPQVGAEGIGGSPLVIEGAGCMSPSVAAALGVTVPPGGAAATALYGGIAGDTTVSLDGGAREVILCMTISAPTNYIGVYATNFATAELGSIRWGTAYYHAMADTNGEIFMTGSGEIVQGATAHFAANEGGIVKSVPGVVETVDAGVTFPDFVVVTRGARVSIQSPDYPGMSSVTGNQCFISLFGAWFDAAGHLDGIPGVPVTCGITPAGSGWAN